MWNEKRKAWITFIGLSVIVVIFFKYMVPWCWPVLLAFLAVSSVYDRLLYLEKRWHIRKTISMAVMLLFTGIIGVGILYLLLSSCFAWCHQEMNSAGGFHIICRELLHQGCSGVERILQIPTQELELMVEAGIESSLESTQKELIPRMMNGSILFGKHFFQMLARIAVFAVLTLLLVREYGKIRKYYYQIPFAEHIGRIRIRISKMITVYVKTQGIIMGIITVIVTIGMAIVGRPNFLLWGVLTGILDVLPFIGTGLILIPFALWMFLQGEIWRAIVLLLVYGLCAFTRNMLEPRIIGGKMELSPVGILLAVFIGIRIYGALGVIFGPLTLILLYEIYIEIIRE